MCKFVKPFVVHTINFSAISVAIISSNVQAKDSEILEITNSLMPKIRVEGQSYKPKSIEQRMAEVNLPGLSVAVFKDGKIRWAKGYGIANKKTGSKVSTDTLFQAGSISKPVAALGALKLVQDGKVDLDKNVNNYLNSWKIDENEFTKEHAVTLRNLLTHTGGLSVHGFPGYKSSLKIPNNVGVLNGEGNTPVVTVNQQPGSAWRYSGGGYTVMEQLVEDVSKQSFEQYMQQHILLPLGMNSSNYEQPLDNSLHGKASAAFYDNGIQIEGDWNNYPEQAAAGLWTTPTDLAKYAIAIQNIRSGQKSDVLSKATVDSMLTEHKASWGLGPELHKRGSGLAFGHGGKNAGFTNYMLAYADSGDGFAIMANGDSASPVIEELRIAISEYYGWDLSTSKSIVAKPLSESLVTNIGGDYTMVAEPFEIEVTLKGDKIDIHDKVRDRHMTFIATGENHITNIESGSEVTFDLNDSGKVVGLTWAGEYKFKKLGV